MCEMIHLRTIQISRMDLVTRYWDVLSHSWDSQVGRCCIVGCGNTLFNAPSVLWHNPCHSNIEDYLEIRKMNRCTNR